MTNATRPDIDGLLSGGQVRRRRRNVAWIGGIAAAIVLVGGGVVALTQLDGGDDGDSKTAAEPTETSGQDSASVPLYVDVNSDSDRLAPGTYRMTVPSYGNGGELEADVTFLGEGWEARSNPTVSDDDGAASIGVYEPVEVAAGSGCSDDDTAATRGVGQTPESLVRELARLPRSEVVQPPTATEAFGLDAVHLRLRVDPNCGVAVYRPVVATTGPRGMSFTEVEKVLIFDFWVAEVEGILVVVDMVRNPDTPRALVDQAAEAVASIDSFTFVPAE